LYRSSSSLRTVSVSGAAVLCTVSPLFGETAGCSAIAAGRTVVGWVPLVVAGAAAARTGAKLDGANVTIVSQAIGLVITSLPRVESREWERNELCNDVRKALGEPERSIVVFPSRNERAAVRPRRRR